MHFDDATRAVRSGEAPMTVARRLVAHMTPQERLWCLDGDGPIWAGLEFMGQGGYYKDTFSAAVVERVGLGGVHFADGPRGCVVGNSTAFAVSMARGATWDPDLEERVGEVIGRELRAAGANLTGAVCVNLLRHPAWGRAQETYGEDPHHVAEMGAAFTRGLQRNVMACVKHFACNSMENARFSVDVSVDEVALHEVYLPHFRRIVQEGVAAVMTAYNSVNGQWCGENQHLIADVLRGEWGFEGFVISDWIFGLRDAAKSLSAGLDIEMPYRMIRYPNLPLALEAGEVSWAEVDEAVARVVATLLRFGDLLAADAPSLTVVGSDPHRRLARDVAGRSIVLLRNEPVGGARVLPMQTDLSLAVLGHLADSVNLGDGGSSDVWDTDCHTALAGLTERYSSVAHDDGSDLDRASAVARGADAAVVVVGYTYLDEGEYIGRTDPSLGALFPAGDEPEVADRFARRISQLAPVETPDWRRRPRGFAVGGDRSSLRLHEADVALIRAVVAANPRTVVVIQAGSAVIVDEWASSVPAIVQSWYGGCRAGEGLADVLCGDVNPSGRLAFSVPTDESHLPAFDAAATEFVYDRWHGWWHLARHGHQPRFAFGFGLSYTSFEIVDSHVQRGADGLVVRARVANTGARDGADVVQVYAELPAADRPPRLVGFARVEVPAAGEAEVEVEVPFDRLALRDPLAGAWVQPNGRHIICVARNAADGAAHLHHVDI
ncbi:MAG: glycoside hydrolase family 3 N-terminal domain-containing protein [Acidimicrobiales bacterium]